MKHARFHIPAAVLWERMRAHRNLWSLALRARAHSAGTPRPHASASAEALEGSCTHACSGAVRKRCALCAARAGG
eukprot:268799-Alexandrium_andersonii.AAC.1